MTEFINATECERLFPDADENLKNVLYGYHCPDMKDFLLQGDSGSKYKDGPEAHNFNFVVHSCQAMNEIRKLPQIGGNQVNCVDNE